MTIEARGSGLLIGSFGVSWVRGSLRAGMLREGRCWAIFLGLHGIAWASVTLRPAASIRVPLARVLQPPELPAVQALPSLRVQLTVTAPRPPAEEGMS